LLTAIEEVSPWLLKRSGKKPVNAKLLTPYILLDIIKLVNTQLT